MLELLPPGKKPPKQQRISPNEKVRLGQSLYLHYKQVMREVMCSKLNKRAPGLSYPPFIKGALAARIYHHISEEAWKMWLSHCVMVINENRLNPSDIKAQARLNKELEDFLFGDGGNRPAGYTPPS